MKIQIDNPLKIVFETTFSPKFKLAILESEAGTMWAWICAETITKGIFAFI